MPAGSTYTPIATTTLNSNTATITFSSIPQTYTDLVLVASGTMTSANTDGVINFNSDTGTNYSRTYLFGNGTSPGTGRNSSAGALLGFYWSTTRSTTIFHILNYKNTTTYKTSLTRNSNPTHSTYIGVSMWQSTSAITRMDLTCGASNWVSGSTFTLYGITAA